MPTSGAHRLPHPTRRRVLQAGGLAATALLFWPGRTPAAQGEFLFGACGHPFNSVEYNANAPGRPGVDYPTQVAMLRRLGMNIYRCDIASNDEGHALNHRRLLDMYEQLSGAGIRLLPMFYPNYSANVSVQENYDRGYAKGVGLATNYGHMFTHCNLGNEWELFKDLKHGIGHRESHYYPERVVRARAWIQGAHEGMKSVKPDAKTSMATAGWFPTWWQHYVMEKVDLDFVDWHWYAEMQSNIDALPVDVTNILDYLWSEFGLPIWISETNARPKEDQSRALNEQRQVDWFDEWYEQCVEHPHCAAMLLYELLDQPVLDSSFMEKNYGLVTFPEFDPDEPDLSQWEWKQLGRRLAGIDHVIGHFGSDTEGWRLGLGREFPGARGNFERDNTTSRAGRWSGRLSGDFSGGGNYVQISRPIDHDLTELRFWARSDDASFVALRLTDSTGQTHQQRLPITPDGSWHPLHVKTFDSGLDYQSWGGADDGTWRGPATRIALLLSRVALPDGKSSGTAWFDGVTVSV